MKLIITQQINANIDHVWHILAEDFANSARWMSGVLHSEAHQNGNMENTSCQGRVCVLDNKPGGLKAEENILTYDKTQYKLVFEVIPHKEKGIQLPVKKNTNTVVLNQINNDLTKVSWQCELDLKLIGKVLKPLLKLGFRKAFNDLLLDMKVFAETGQVSEKKRKFDEKHLSKALAN